MLVAFTRVEASTWHGLREASSQIRERKSRHMYTLLQQCLRVPVPRPCDSPSNGAFVAVAQDQRILLQMWVTDGLQLLRNLTIYKR